MTKLLTSLSDRRPVICRVGLSVFGAMQMAQWRK